MEHAAAKNIHELSLGLGGAALLLLRVVVGTSAIVEAILAVAGADSPLSWATVCCRPRSRGSPWDSAS